MRGLRGSRIGQYFYPRGGGIGDNGLDWGFSWEAKSLAVTLIQGRKENKAKTPFITLVKTDHGTFFWKNLGGWTHQCSQPI